MQAELPVATSAERVVVTRGGKELGFAVVNAMTAFRARTLMTKEPGTVAWLEEIKPGEVLVDVGANVGMYALCAAAFFGARVFAFEPESQNYAVLNRNIHDNRLDEAVAAFCVALSDETRFDRLYLSDFTPGGSCHNFGASIGPDLRPMKAAFRQGCFATTLDALIGEGVLPVPQHIKIDVDGNEHKVIRGAARALGDAALRSVLVEINTNLEEHWGVVDALLERGFDYSREEAERAQRKEGFFKGTGNYVFRR
jgi:FkbM family methyltransferase